MALILNIDTSGELAMVLLAENGLPLASLTDKNAMQHASFLHTAAQKIMAESKRNFAELDAVAVNNGPGSYTGLRVGLASAKGICHALQKPLITLSSLQIMADTARIHIIENELVTITEMNKFLYCPMIDARRMDVFFGLYAAEKAPLVLPAATTITETFLVDFLSHKQILFFGNGAAKWKQICNHPNAIFIDSLQTPEKSMSALSDAHFATKNFADLAYSIPFYCKEFYDPGSSKRQL